MFPQQLRKALGLLSWKELRVCVGQCALGARHEGVVYCYTASGLPLLSLLIPRRAIASRKKKMGARPPRLQTPTNGGPIDSVRFVVGYRV